MAALTPPTDPPTTPPSSAAAAAASAVPVPPTADVHRVVTTELGEMTEMTSMCPTCEQNGITRLMLTKIPHFREIIVSSFECGNPECRETNREIQFGGQYGPRHIVVELAVRNAADMNRQVVKSENAVLIIPELELEMPRETQKGSLNTVEGLLVQTIEGLMFQQPLRRVMEPAIADQIEAFCAKLESYRDGSKPFTVKIDDPSGNSFIEPIYTHYHPTLDPQISRTEFPRTDEDRLLLGLEDDYNTRRNTAQETAVDEGEIPEVMCLTENCSACRVPGELKMHKCDIPYFQETIIMSFRCDACGYRSSEVKNGGAISAKGMRVTLKVENPEDMKRDVLKSNTATLNIPEIDLELAPGTLGGFFSTVEGVLQQVVDQLSSLRHADFDSGDGRSAASHNSASEMATFLLRVTALKEGTIPFTLILDDPLANVYIQNPKAHLPAPQNEDPQLVTESYERSFEQDEELGLHQMQC